MDKEGGIVKLVSRDEDEYEVPLDVARMSELVKNITDDDESEGVHIVPLKNVSSVVLKKVIEFITHHKEEPMTPIQTPFKSAHLEDLVQAWYFDFVAVEQALLFELVAAANYMDIKELLDLACLAVSILIKDKTAGELRNMFNITDDGSVDDKNQTDDQKQWGDVSSN